LNSFFYKDSYSISPLTGKAFERSPKEKGNGPLFLKKGEAYISPFLVLVQVKAVKKEPFSLRIAFQVIHPAVLDVPLRGIGVEAAGDAPAFIAIVTQNP
jgi:hypothetical protein